MKRSVPAKLYLCQFSQSGNTFPFSSRCQNYALSASHFYVKAVRSLSSHKSPAFMFLSVILCHFLSYKRREMFICVLYMSYTNYVYLKLSYLRYSVFCQSLSLCDCVLSSTSLQATFVLFLLCRYDYYLSYCILCYMSLCYFCLFAGTIVTSSITELWQNY